MQQDIQRLGHTVDHIKQQSRTTSPKPILKADYVKQEQLQDLQRSIDEKINQAADRFTQVPYGRNAGRKKVCREESVTIIA